MVDVLPGMNAGASPSAVPSPMEGSGTAWVLLGSWALGPARPTPIHPRPERRGFSALLVTQAWRAATDATSASHRRGTAAGQTERVMPVQPPNFVRRSHQRAPHVPLPVLAGGS